MATIRNTITMNDRMTPALKSIVKALESTITALASVDNISDSAFRDAQRDAQNAANAVRDLANGVEDLETPINNTTGGFSRWQSAIITANQALQLVESTMQGIVKLGEFMDTYTSINARLNLINDGLQTTSELQQKIYESAQRSHGAYEDVADTVTKLNLLASDAFTTNDEAIKFAEIMNKAFTVSGASASEMSSAMLQITQALSSGALQGDEFRSVRENAPLVAQAIADYMGVTKGEMKELSSQGAITADIIKNAVFTAGEEINEQFQEMPITFSAAMQMIRNAAVLEFQPVVEMFSQGVNSEMWTEFANTAIAAIKLVISYLIEWGNKLQQIASSPAIMQLATVLRTSLFIVVNVMASLITVALDLVNIFANNWSIIAPIIWGVVSALTAYNIVVKAATWATLLYTAVTKGLMAVKAAFSTILAFVNVWWMIFTGNTYAATAATLAFNGALTVTQILILGIVFAIIAIIAIVFIVVAVINKATGSTISAIGVIVGALATAAAFVWNLFIAIVDLVLAVVNAIWNSWANFANFFANVFNDPIASIIKLFGGLANYVLSTLRSIASAIDAVFGSNLTAAVSGWQSSLSTKVSALADKYGNGTYTTKYEQSNLTAESLGLSRWSYNSAWSSGYSLGEGISDSLSNLGISDIAGNVSDIASNISDLDIAGLNEAADAASNGGSGSNNPTGGTIDTVNEVNLSDEDLKYLRDIAEIDYVNKYTTLRPIVNATFGDVHEEADVNKVIALLEQAVTESYESSLARG